MVGIYVLNDDVTPWTFVIAVMREVFDKPSDLSHSIMLETHNKGRALCGIYDKDQATKMSILARSYVERAGRSLQFDVRVVDNSEPA